MPNQPFPNTDQLREMYKDVFSNEAVTALSLATHWTNTNCSVATNEESYLARAMEIGGTLFVKIKDASESVGR